MKNGRTVHLPRRYSRNHTWCRDLGHAWMPRAWNLHEHIRETECDRCTTIRREHLNGFHVARRSYRYPRGYHIAGSRREVVAIQARMHLAKLIRSGAILLRSTVSMTEGVNP